MEMLRAGPPSSARLCLQWTILTACRSGEARLAVLREIQEGDWVIPPERTKARRMHVVPLPAAALQILELARGLHRVRGCHLIFPAPDGKPLSDMTLVMILRRMGVADKTVVHGLRSSFRDWASEVARAREPVIEAALAHAVRDRTMAAYARAVFLDERRVLLAKWADFLEGAMR
jgi:integrase